MMALVKPVISGSLRSLAIGSYHGGNGTPPVPQGDTFVIDPVNLTVRAIGSTTTGVATSSLTLTSADLTKFMLLVADYSAAGVQLHMFREGALVSAPLAAFTTRAIPTSTIRLGIGYDISIATGGLNGPIQESAWGLWSGVNLTTEEKLSMYSTFKNMLANVITIS